MGACIRQHRGTAATGKLAPAAPRSSTDAGYKSSNKKNPGKQASLGSIVLFLHGQLFTDDLSLNTRFPYGVCFAMEQVWFLSFQEHTGRIRKQTGFCVTGLQMSFGSLHLRTLSDTVTQPDPESRTWPGTQVFWVGSNVVPNGQPG